MTEEEYKIFLKRYDKFKKNNLPTPFWDEERQTFEYVNFSSSSKGEIYPKVNKNLLEALGDLSFSSLYYPFTARIIQGSKENGKYVFEAVVCHSHEHFFEDVVMALYYSPESFNISKEEEEFYSKQELKFLRRVQKYLQFIGLKDRDKYKIPVSRYRNKNQTKYENAYIIEFSDNHIKEINDNNRNFVIHDWYPEYPGDHKYNPREFRALIVDKDENFKMYIEYTKEELKSYKEIKNIYVNDKYKDDDKLIIKYFKVLEIFE